MEKTLYITKGNAWVSFYINDDGYYGYNKRDAIKNYREKHGLKGKHLRIVDWTKHEPSLVELLADYKKLCVE